MTNYDKMSLVELKEIAKQKGLKSVSSMRKQELVDILVSVDKKLEELKKKKTQKDDAVSQKEKKDVQKKSIEKKVVQKKSFENKNNEMKNKKNVEIEKKNLDKQNNEKKNMKSEKVQHTEDSKVENSELEKNQIDKLDSGETKEGILEVLPDGYGFVRCDNYLPGENDVYVSPAQIRKFNLKTGDIIVGNTKIKSQNEKFSALLYVKSVNGFTTNETQKRQQPFQ